jgi:hypothetical protein
MTISSAVDRVQITSGSTITITNLEIQDATQVTVTHKDANGVETTYVKDTDYTVNAALTEVTLTTALLASETATATLNVPRTQATDYKNNGTFNVETLEDSLDKLTLLFKQEKERIDRAVVWTVSSTNSEVKIGDPTADGQYLKWNESNTTFEPTTVAPGSGISDVVDDVSPQLGGNLDTNSFHIDFDTSHGFRDENGNEQLFFTTTASAVNYLTVTNAATGSSPTISAAGDDTNVDLNLNTKGTGDVFVTGGSSALDLDIRSADQSTGVQSRLTLSSQNSASQYDCDVQLLLNTNTATDSSEDTSLLIRTRESGTLGNRMWIDNGAYMQGATGGDQGAGTFNATGVYDDGVLLTCYVFDAALDGDISNKKWDDKVPNRENEDGTVEERKHEDMRKFKKRLGSDHDPLDIDKYAAHWKEKRHLTSLPNEDGWTSESKISTGSLLQRLWETVEIQAVHIENLNQRLKKLEKNKE